MLDGRKILLAIGGGIAAYKCLDLIRRLQEQGASVTPVMTRAAGQFVTPLTVSALAGEKVFQDLFDLTDEADMGHIELSRAADLIILAPATADLMAKMAGGHADDLVSTVLMATDTQVLMAPSMNVRMWEHPATQRNLKTLIDDGIMVVGPNEGNMACGEYGPGRMAEVPEIIAAAQAALSDGPLKGKHVLVTSGPTHEPIDPVRYIANRSSGAQGSAIANALAALGAKVSFVTGPARAPMPTGCDIIPVETGAEMAQAAKDALPADAVVCAAAVADWFVRGEKTSKIKKQDGKTGPDLDFEENEDILKSISKLSKNRPDLVVGFAAETDDVLKNGVAKRKRKGCDWIVVNDVSPSTGIMGGSENDVVLVTADGPEDWPRMSKVDVAKRLADRIAKQLSK